MAGLVAGFVVGFIVGNISTSISDRKRFEKTLTYYTKVRPGLKTNELGVIVDVDETHGEYIDRALTSRGYKC